MSLQLEYTKGLRMIEQYMTNLFEERIKKMLNLPGAYITRNGNGDDDKIGGYNLISDKDILLFTCTRDPKKAPGEFKKEMPFEIYTITVNDTIVAQKPFSYERYYNDIDTLAEYEGRTISVNSLEGCAIYNIFKSMKDRYEKVIRHAEFEKYNRDDLASVPVQQKAYDFFGQFLDDSKQR